MAGRYDPETYDRHFDFGKSSAFAPAAQLKPRHDPLEDALRFAAGLAPGAGALIGGGIGALAGGLPTAGIGAIPGATLGAGLGGAAGTALGAGLGFGAEQESRPAREAEENRLAREQERQARSQAAMQLLGSFR